MILNKAIIEDIKEKSGLMFEKAGDFSILSSLIYEETGRTIGITTLKRLFYYIKDDRKASEYTLNTIAQYVGFKSWEDYSSAKNLASEWRFKDDTLYIHDLEINTKIAIQYLDRKITFIVVNFESKKYLKVVSSINSSLNTGDLLLVYRIRKGEILEAEKVIRGNNIGNYKTHGEILNLELIKD